MDCPTLQVLLVEDEDSKIGQWYDAVDAFNSDVEKNGFLISKQSAKSVNEALKALEVSRLDALVVDLRLQAEAGVGEDNDDGNRLVQQIIERQAVGIVVYTGQKAQADVKAFRQVQVMDKAEGLHQVFDWLCKQKDMFLRLRGVNLAVQRETARIFFRSIWPRWEQWAKGEVDLTDALARHVTAHVHDSLLHASGGAAHREETYFVPPLKDWLDTGDLVRLDGVLWIVVTPRCDLAREGKVATVLVAKCQDISERWAAIDPTTKSGLEKLRKIAQHEQMPKQHFLPPAFDDDGKQLGPWMVQFHDLGVFSFEEAKKSLTPARLASLAPQFVPSLVERFGAYFSRIGTPDLASE